MNNQQTKRGRKPKPHVAKDGTHINGLRFREHDKRWILADGRTFSEPDERKAIKRFREMTGQFFADEARLNAKLENFVKRNPQPPTDDNTNLVVIPSKLPLWEYVAFEIQTRPKWVAEQTGDERLGYLDAVKPPVPLPTPKDLEKLWTDHADCSGPEIRKVEVAWKDFVDTTGIKSLKEITDDIATAYEDNVKAREWSDKSKRHRFNRVRRIFSFAIERKIAKEEMARILANLTFKIKKSPRVLKPKAITPLQFQALLKTAKGNDKAMVLLMLNCGMYIQEAIRVRWDEIENGCLITVRQKTGGCLRVAVLWQETLDALAELKRKGDHIFIGQNGLPITVFGASKRFRAVRKIAKVEEVTSQLRDGAYQAMAEANINSDLCKLLVGHSCGLKDNYVLRNPAMVAPACLAIYKHFFA